MDIDPRKYYKLIHFKSRFLFTWDHQNDYLVKDTDTGMDSTLELA